MSPLNLGSGEGQERSTEFELKRRAEETADLQSDEERLSELRTVSYHAEMEYGVRKRAGSPGGRRLQPHPSSATGLACHGRPASQLLFAWG